MFLYWKKLVFLVRFVHKIRPCRTCTKNCCSTWKLLSDGILPVCLIDHNYIRTYAWSKCQSRPILFCGVTLFVAPAVCCCSASFSRHCLSVHVHYCLYMQVSCLRYLFPRFYEPAPFILIICCVAVAPRVVLLSWLIRSHEQSTCLTQMKQVRNNIAHVL